MHDAGNSVEQPHDGVWVFKAPGAQFASGVFTSQERAEIWIRKHRLDGVLTWYPLDVGAYDWAVERGTFRPSKEHHMSAEFIGRFGGGEIHQHYESGARTD